MIQTKIMLEQYTTCTSYSSDTSLTTLNSDNGRKINTIHVYGAPYIKRELEGNQSKRNDIKDKKTCNEYNYYVSTKYSLFLEGNNTCVHSFKICEEYNTNTNQNECELIHPIYSSYPEYLYTFKCIFNADDKSCKKQKKNSKIIKEKMKKNSLKLLIIQMIKKYINEK